MYEGADTIEQAAWLGQAIARNHAFVDGNKRAAYLAMGLFAALNGKRLRPDQVDAIRTILELAAGNLDEAGLAKWIGANLRS
jgi:death-on-curing protein